jgi:hypothetical protein
MKTKYPSIFGLLAAFMLVASFVVPTNLANPAPVEAGLSHLLRWAIVDTPNSVLYTQEISPDSEVDKFVVASNGKTIYAAVYTGTSPRLAKSTNMGVSWSGTPFGHLLAKLGATYANYLPVWDVAVAPDDPNLVAVVLDDPATTTYGPTEVWISTDGGTTWDDALVPALGNNFISAIAISMDYGGKRDILIGTRDGTGAAATATKLFVRALPSMGTWVDQSAAAGDPGSTWPGGDVVAAKFSPTYIGDATIVVVYCGQTGVDPATHLVYGSHDLNANTTDWAILGLPTEVRDPTSAVDDSPDASSIITADLELPSDFSGQAASLRRSYVSLDAVSTDNVSETGIYRIDDTIVYELMDTTTPAAKRISSIAYFGTFASGKLLAGEVLGFPCTATVPTWFTDSPTTCPIPCWYPALKPTTGAAGTAATGFACLNTQSGYGNAQVAWTPDGATAFVGTGSATLSTFATPSGGAAVHWPDGYLAHTTLDESAFGLSRNNGETWNQLSQIDTKLNKLTDVASAADCSTTYLASSNNGTRAELCDSFDSVWRSSSNPAVSSPLPAAEIGTIWERVLCRLTATSCNMTAQSEYAILRLAPDKTDGQIVFWAAGGTGTSTTTTIGGFTVGPNTKAVMWTPDYGDWWANINPRLEVQDMAAESSTVLYILSLGGLVQKMPYSGAAWSSAVASVDTILSQAHSIAAYGDGNVLVGAGSSGIFAASYSPNSAGYFVPSANYLIPGHGNLHVAYDPAFKTNATIFVGDDSANAGTGYVYRNSLPFTNWTNTMLAGFNHTDYYGIALAYTGGALYAAHIRNAAAAALCAVERTIYPLLGIPKPGVYWSWDCMDNSAEAAAATYCFSLEPSSLKLCGCLTLDTDTTLYAIDNAAYTNTTRTTGMLWAFTDCLAKKGPKLITADKMLIGCDPVSGRNQEINFTWEQLCLASAYDIEIAKDAYFTQKVFDYVGAGPSQTASNYYTPDVTTSPAMIFPVGATDASWPLAYSGTEVRLVSQLECGHTYYWHVQVRGDAMGGFIRSPSSAGNTFTIKAGLPVSTPYYGVQLLAPNNGGMGIPVKPVSFSWSPFKETTKYKFVLAKDAAMTQVVKEADVATTAFEYEGALDYSSNYFWRVMSVEPAPSDWSATFSFLTEAAPPVAPGPTPAPPTPLWVWVVIAIGAILVIVTLVLIFKTRRV